MIWHVIFADSFTHEISTFLLIIPLLFIDLWHILSCSFQILATTTAGRLAVVDVETGAQLITYDSCEYQLWMSITKWDKLRDIFNCYHSCTICSSPADLHQIVLGNNLNIPICEIMLCSLEITQAINYTGTLCTGLEMNPFKNVMCNLSPTDGDVLHAKYCTEYQ